MAKPRMRMGSGSIFWVFPTAARAIADMANRAAVRPSCRAARAGEPLVKFGPLTSSGKRVQGQEPAEVGVGRTRRPHERLSKRGAIALPPPGAWVPFGYAVCPLQVRGPSLQRAPLLTDVLRPCTVHRSPGGHRGTIGLSDEGGLSRMMISHSTRAYRKVTMTSTAFMLSRLSGRKLQSPLMTAPAGLPEEQSYILQRFIRQPDGLGGRRPSTPVTARLAEPDGLGAVGPPWLTARLGRTPAGRQQPPPRWPCLFL